MTSGWVFDTAANGIGKLASATASGTAVGGPAGGFERTFTYDSLTRPDAGGACAVNNNTWFNFSATYDANSRLASVTYPSGLVDVLRLHEPRLSRKQITGLDSKAYWDRERARRRTPRHPADRRQWRRHPTELRSVDRPADLDRHRLRQRRRELLLYLRRARQRADPRRRVPHRDLLLRQPQPPHLGDGGFQRQLADGVQYPAAKDSSPTMRSATSRSSPTSAPTRLSGSPTRRCRMRCRRSTAPSPRPSPTTPTATRPEGNGRSISYYLLQHADRDHPPARTR